MSPSLAARQKKPIKLLLVEDNESDAGLLLRHLNHAGLNLQYQRVDSTAALEQALAKTTWDIVVSDFHLSGFDANDALALVQHSDADVPFIVVSGLVGEERAVALMRAGAQDFVMKHSLVRLAPAIERELRDAKNRRKQRRLSDKLKLRDERLQLTLTAIGDGTWDCNPRTGKVHYSDEWKAMLDYQPSDIDGNLDEFRTRIHPDDLESVLLAQKRQLDGETERLSCEIRMRCQNGSWKWVLIRSVILERNGRNEPIREVGTMTDISSAKTAQRALQESAKLLNNLAHEVPGMLYQLRLYPDGRMTFPFISDAVRKLYEMAPRDVAHDASILFAKVHPDDLPELLKSINRSAADLSRWQSEHRIITPSKGTLWVHGESQPQRLVDGGILWHGYVHDVSERKNSEAELSLLQACINQVNDTVIVTEAEPVDQPGPKIVYVNSAFEKQTGYSASEAIGNTPRMLQGPKTDPEAIRSLRESLRTWKPTRGEVLNYCKDGTPYWAELDTAPVANENGWYTHWISIQRDVTSRKRSELERERLIGELETRNVELDAYNQWVAHDLRNPIISMRGLADLAELSIDRDDSKSALSYVQRIAESANMADRLIKNLMALAKLGRRALAPSVQPLKPAVLEVLAELDSLEQNRSVQRQTQIDVADDLTVYADETLLGVILRNLISNAITHRDADRKLQVMVRARYTVNPAGVEIQVADTGIGIESCAHDRVFHLFERINESSDGTGVGLAMVKRAASIHNGHAVLLNSEPGVGSTFSVWLPLSDEQTGLAGQREV